MSIRFKILCIVLGFFVISGIIFAVYSGATTENYRQLRIAEVSKTIAYESERVWRIFNELERNVIDIAMIGRQAYLLGRSPEEFKRLSSQQRHLFGAFRYAAGGGIWYEPFVLSPDTQRVCYYVYYDSASGQEIYDPLFEGEEYDYHTQSWYTEITSRLTGRRSVGRAAPYYDSIGTISFLSTIGAGIYNENDELIGMATLDWRIQDIVDRLVAANPVQNSYVLLASYKDDYILSYTHPDGADLTGKSLQLLPWLENLHFTDIDDLVDVGIGHFEIDGVDYYAFSRLLGNELLFSIQVPRKEIFAEVESLNFRFSIIVVISSIFLLSLTFLLLSRLINRPLVKLTSGVVTLGSGNLEKKIDIHTKDEIGMLASAFNKMTVELKTSLEQSAKERAEKERINAELSFAAKVQASMLPGIFPPFPHRHEFDIYACMQPAKEACGDFYDFFLIDNNTLAVVMADVTDKGMPAALFMVIAKTLIKINAQYGKMPKEVFETVNNQLCENNEANMFVTAFMGYLDIQSGNFTYVNAGHNPPLIKNLNGNFRMLPVKSGLVLAGLPDVSYRQEEIILNEGDELFLYTDGITEAANKKREFFGEERLIETANKYHNIPFKEFTVSIRREIDKFAAGANQADDITMLALRYKGRTRELVLDAHERNLPDVFAFVETMLRKNAGTPELRAEIKLAVEEIFVNIAHYAYKPNTGSAAIRAWIDKGVVADNMCSDILYVEFEDSGIPFNPLEKEDPDIDTSSDDRKIGGLGIYLVKKNMDHVEYRYQDGKNILTMQKIIQNEVYR